jgi:hypothetical protein
VGCAIDYAREIFWCMFSNPFFTSQPTL